MKHRRLLAEAMLILITFFWGTTFVLVKHIIEMVPVHWFHTLRFGLAALAVWGVALSSASIRTEAKVHLKKGAVIAAGTVLGFALLTSHAFQTFGLKTTTASKSAFISGTAALWVPVLMLAIFRTRQEGRTFLAAIIGLVGLFLLVSKRGFEVFFTEGFVTGDILTLACAFMVAFHIIFTKRYSHRYPTTLLTAIQLTVVALLSLVASVLCGEAQVWHFSGRLYMAIIFLALIPTAFNFWVMTRMQRYTTAGRAAVIFLFEPVFAAATAWVALEELFTATQWLGAAVILMAILLLELQIGPFAKNPEPHSPETP